MSERFFCCDVCDRYRTCGSDCGSCDASSDPEDYLQIRTEARADACDCYGQGHSGPCDAVAMGEKGAGK